MDGLTSMTQFGEGFFFEVPRVADEVNWDAWYRGETAQLLPQPTIGNGLRLFPRTDLVRFNPYRVIADFFANAVLSEPPTAETQVAALQAWFNEHFERVFKVLRLGARWWSIKDRAIFVTFMDGSIDTIDPTQAFRIGRDADDDQLVGHIFCQIYAEQTDDVLMRPNQYHRYNRARIWKWAPEMDPAWDSVQDFEYVGTLERGIIGVPIGEERPTGITSLCSVGEGRGWFNDARDLVARYMIRLTNTDSELNYYANSPRLVPNRLFSGEFTPEGVAGEETPTNRLEGYRNAIRPVIPVDDEDSGSVGYIAQEPQFTSSQELLGIYDYLILLTAGASPETLGFQQGKNESGTAREKAKDAANARATGFRRDLAMCLPMIIAGMGAPPGDASFSWVTGPFETRTDRNAEIRADVGAGIISVQTAARLLGYQEQDLADAPQDTQTSDSREG